MVGDRNKAVTYSNKYDNVSVTTLAARRLIKCLDILADILLWVSYIILALVLTILGAFKYISPAMAGLLMFIFLSTTII